MANKYSLSDRGKKAIENSGYLLKQPDATIHIHWITMVQAVVIFLLTTMVIYIFKSIADILLTLFIAVFISAAIDPLLKALQKKGATRGTAIAIVFVALLLTIIVILSLFIPTLIHQLNGLANNWPRLSASISKLLGSNDTVNSKVNDVVNGIFSNSGSLAKSLTNITTSFFTGIIRAITIIVISIYMLTSGKSLASEALRYIPNPYYRASLYQMFSKVSVKLGQWLRGQLINNTIMATMIFVGVNMAGMTEYSLLLALIAFALEMVPMFGAWLSTTIAVMIAASFSLKRALLVLVIYLIANMIQSNYITPMVMKKALGLQPLVLITAIMVGGKLFGALGIILAAPITATLSVIFNEIGEYITTPPELETHHAQD